MLVSKEVYNTYNEIQEAIQKALNGEEPDLKVTMEDEKLNLDSYKQIVTKIYAMIRFKLYQKIKD